jgi:hypothetical protein
MMINGEKIFVTMGFVSKSRPDCGAIRAQGHCRGRKRSGVTRIHKALRRVFVLEISDGENLHRKINRAMEWISHRTQSLINLDPIIEGMKIHVDARCYEQVGLDGGVRGTK